MILISEFKTLMQNIASEVEGIDSVVFAATEHQLIKKLAGKKGVIMACSFPAATNTTTRDEDNYGDTNRIFIFIIEHGPAD